MNNLDSHQHSPGFIEGVGIALLVSIVASILFSVFGWMIPYGFLAAILIISSGLVYLLYLITRSRHRTGRVTAISFYVVVSSVLVVADVPLIWVLLAVLGMIWLVRSLYFYNSLLSAFLDMGLTVFSIAGAVATYLHTESLFLSVWSLMLVQACFVWIPASWRRHDSGRTTALSSGHFDVAFRAAEGAARKLANQSTN